MRPSRAALLAIAAGLLLPSVAFACLWDYDTIKMERTRFPGTLELITGKFLRHSPEFYQWRIANRLKRLEADPTNAALLDDLAVAYDKTGQQDKAIETALKTEKLHPGRYETASNLATFYFHAGKPEEGIPHIDRALKINPDAHFGREKYQKYLTEYVLLRRKGNPQKLPLAVEVYVEKDFLNPSGPLVEKRAVTETFEKHLRPKEKPDQPLTTKEAEPAIKAVLGMMKFAKYDSPILLEALGTLLVQEGWEPHADAKLLAGRAFLKASYEVPEGPTRIGYRGMANGAIHGQTRRRDEHGQITLEQVEADFQKELEEGGAWYADLRERELSWIRDGKDPEVEFDKLYEAEPEVSGMDVQDPKLSAGDKQDIAIIVAMVLAGLLALAVVVTFVAGVGMLVCRQLRKSKARNKPGRDEATQPVEPS